MRSRIAFRMRDYPESGARSARTPKALRTKMFSADEERRGRYSWPVVRLVRIRVGSGAGSLGSVRKLDQISQDVERFVTLRIDQRIFVVTVRCSAIR